MKNVIISIIIICFLFIQSYSETTGYDSVIKINKSVVQGKVLQVTNTSIEMDPKGSIPFLLIPRDSVEMILYSDGTTVNFVTKHIKKTPKPMRLYCEDNYMKEYAPALQIMSGKDPYITGIWYLWRYSIPNLPGKVDIQAPRLDGVSQFFYYDADSNKVPFIIKQNGSYVLETGSVLGALNIFKKPKYKIKNFTLQISIYDNYVLVDSKTFTEPEFKIDFRVADDLSPEEKMTPAKDMYFPELTYKNIVLKPHYTMSYVNIYSFGTAGPFPFNTEFLLNIEYTK